MSRNREALGATILAAALCSFAMIAQQIAAKSVRDALFLSHFEISALPRMVIASALLSVFAVLAAGRLLQAKPPERVVPASFLVSAVTLVGIWGAEQVAPRAAALLLYFHVAVFGAVLVSWFWALLSERFDARTGRQSLARIATGGALGGLAGGLLAERVGALSDARFLLLALAGLHFVCAHLATRIQGSHRSPARSPQPDSNRERSDARQPETSESQDRPLSGWSVLKGSSYLRHLGILVLLGILSAALLDFVFKSEATQRFGEEQDLLRFFAFFYTATALITFVVQTLLVPRLLQSPQALSRNVASLPLLVVLGGLASLIYPTLFVVAAARGVENIARNSVFRSSYEVFFFPVSAAQKRATKTLIDVGSDRVGDILGAAVVQVVLWSVGLSTGAPVLLLLSVGFAAVALFVALKLRAGYVATLQASILSRLPKSAGPHLSESTDFEQSLPALSLAAMGESSSVVLSVPAVGESSSAFLSSGSVGEPSSALLTPPLVGESSSPFPPPLPDDSRDAPRSQESREEGESRREKLESKNQRKVLDALADPSPLKDEEVETVIELLAWDAVSRDAAKALRKTSTQGTDRLRASLLDPAADFAIRRRLPAVLVHHPGSGTVDALLAAQKDPRFEVRYRSSLALSQMQKKDPSLAVNREQILAIVAEETKVDRRIWEKRQLLDEIEASDETPFYRDVLRDRSHRSLEHLFYLLTLVYPREPLRVAYDALHTEDPALRSTALEYLESILPAEIREPLWPLLGGDPSKPGSPKTDREVLDSLMSSHESIALKIRELRGNKLP